MEKPHIEKKRKRDKSDTTTPWIIGGVTSSRTWSGLLVADLAKKWAALLHSRSSGMGFEKIENELPKRNIPQQKGPNLRLKHETTTKESVSTCSFSKQQSLTKGEPLRTRVIDLGSIGGILFLILLAMILSESAKPS